MKLKIKTACANVLTVVSVMGLGMWVATCAAAPGTWFVSLPMTVICGYAARAAFYDYLELDEQLKAQRRHDRAQRDRVQTCISDAQREDLWHTGL